MNRNRPGGWTPDELPYLCRLARSIAAGQAKNALPLAYQRLREAFPDQSFPRVSSAVAVRNAAAGVAGTQPQIWSYTRLDVKSGEPLSENEKILCSIPPELLDALLLYHGDKLEEDAAEILLGLDAGEFDARRTQAEQFLTELLTNDDALEDAPETADLIITVMGLAKLVQNAYLPPPRPGNGRVHRLFPGVCALLAVCALIPALLWGTDFMTDRTGQPAFHQEGTRQWTQAPSLYSFSYHLSDIPAGFRRVQHTRSANAAHILYENSQGDSIAFSQEVARRPVTGFVLENSRELSIKKHPARIRTESGLQSVYWYQDYYCYTLVTTLPEDQAVSIAESASFDMPPTPQKVPLEALPARYTPDMAVENEDLILSDGNAGNLQRLQAFVADCAAKRDSALRVADFTEKGTRIFDLQMLDGQLYCTVDSRRDGQSPQPLESGREYTAVSLWETPEQVRLMLRGSGQEADIPLFSIDTNIA